MHCRRRGSGHYIIKSEHWLAFEDRSDQKSKTNMTRKELTRDWVPPSTRFKTVPAALILIPVPLGSNRALVISFCDVVKAFGHLVGKLINERWKESQDALSLGDSGIVQSRDNCGPNRSTSTGPVKFVPASCPRTLSRLPLSQALGLRMCRSPCMEYHVASRYVPI